MYHYPFLAVDVGSDAKANSRSSLFEQETLTGFKWMGNRAKGLLDQGNTVLFAFEEAIGTTARTFADV